MRTVRTRTITPPRWLWLLLGVLFIAVLAACSAASPTPAAPAQALAQKPAEQKPAAPPAPAQATTAPAAKAPAAEQPKMGGSLTIRWWTGDPPALDPFLNTSFRSQEFAGFFYSRLLKFDSGPGIGGNAFVPVGDLAESWSVSQEGLTYTFNLRANAKRPNKTPLNGRALARHQPDRLWV